MKLAFIFYNELFREGSSDLLLAAFLKNTPNRNLFKKSLKHKIRKNGYAVLTNKIIMNIKYNFLIDYFIVGMQQQIFFWVTGE
jgi:hypothetical protein